MSKYIWGLLAIGAGLFLILDGSQTTITTTTEVTVLEGREVATFAAGCFWCSEAAFQELDGVDSVVSGYGGGEEVDPTYEQVYTNTTGHREANQIIYDPGVITYLELLSVLWQVVDPTDDGGQFVDRGSSYTTAIFAHNEQQAIDAKKSIEELEKSERFGQAKIVTPVIDFTTFYVAEEYHQDFYLKSTERYKSYENASGREQFRSATWE